jgi:nitrogen regulatory protein P-II 1
MKLIIAVIQPEELPAIKEELLKRSIYKFTVTNARGQGKEIPVQEIYRGISHEITLLKKVRLEIAVNDDFMRYPAIDLLHRYFFTLSSGIGNGKLVDAPFKEFFFNSR